MIGEVLTIEFEKRITPHQVRPKCYECTYTKVFTTMWWESGFDAGKLVCAVSFFSLSLPSYSFFFSFFFYLRRSPFDLLPHLQQFLSPFSAQNADEI